MAAFVAILAVLPSCADPDDDAAKPNVILLVIDTLRADHLSGYGYERDTTPRLDKLMAEGVRFDRSLSISSWSAPSHISIITGTRDDKHGVLNWGQRIRNGISPLASLMKDAGYRTGLFSTHMILHKTVERVTEGIDKQLVLDNKQDRELLPAASTWVKETEEPFFLYTCVMTPHAPYNKYPPRYDETLFTDTPEGGDKEFPFTAGQWVGEGGIPKSVQLDGRKDVGYYVNRYDRAIRYIDELIGKFLDDLEEAGKLDNTLVVITSDHGEAFGEHGSFAHELYLYDYLIHVPLIMRFPGRIPAGSTWREQVSSVDITPTILRFCGLEPPKYVDGQDLSQWLESGERPDKPRVAFAAYRKDHYDRLMTTNGRYKLLVDQERGTEAVIDLKEDPEERTNLLQGRVGEIPKDVLVGLRARMRHYLNNHRIAMTAMPDTLLDPDVLEEMIQLGYISGDGR